MAYNKQKLCKNLGFSHGEHCDICHCNSDLAFIRKNKIVCISYEEIPKLTLKMQISFVNETPEL
jgi:hypothetical protein